MEDGMFPYGLQEKGEPVRFSFLVLSDLAIYAFGRDGLKGTFDLSTKMVIKTQLKFEKSED